MMAGLMRAWHALAVCALATISPAAAQPLLCDEPGLTPPADRVPATPASLVGTYRCVGEGLSITLRLDADGRFEQRYAVEATSFSEAERTDLEQSGRVGRWRLEQDVLVLFERPRREPVIRLLKTEMDPSVWMRVEVRLNDGRPAQGVYVGKGADANPQSQLDDGVLTIPKTYAWKSGVRQIVRQGDDMKLFAFTPTEGGSNVFKFIYSPSEVEPFEIRGKIVDATAGAIAVPLGIGGALLKRE